MEPSSGKGFNFGVAEVGFPGMSGALTPDSVFADAVLRKEIVRVDVQQNDRVELFAYFINFPFLDYWVWDKIWRMLERYISDQDATRPIKWWSLNPELNFVVTDPSTATDEAKTKALFQVIRMYFNSIHFLYGSCVQAMQFANLRGYPIATRAMDKLKVTTLNSILQQMNGYPISSVVTKYMLGQSRILEFRPEPAVMMHAMPIYIYEGNSLMESGGKTMADLGWNTRSKLLPTFQELGSLGLTISNYETTAGSIINYLYNEIVNGQTYLLQTLGFTDKVLKIGSKLRSFFEQAGIFDTEFSFDQIVKDVNSLPLYDGLDFVKQMMIFADRPRPIIKHNKPQMYPNISGTDPEDAFIFRDPWDFIYSNRVSVPKVLNAGGVLFDRYEYLQIDTNDADFQTVLDTQDWSAAVGVESSLPVANEQYPIGKLPYTVLSKWYRPYQDFYVEQPDQLDPDKETIGEKGIQYLVNEEYMAGLFMPRYVVMPTINNMDMYQCGFYKILMHEWRASDPWSAWAVNFELYEAGTTWTLNPWYSNSGTIWDILLWVGADLTVGPERAMVHPLASQATWFKGGADPRRIAVAGTTEDGIMNTMAQNPSRPFTYRANYPDVPMVAGTAANAWDVIHSQWAVTSAAQDTMDHTLGILNHDRDKVWLAITIWDPSRPYRVRYANYIPQMMALYRDRVELVTTNMSALFSNANIKTVPMTKDNSRYFSSYRRLGVSRTPLAAASDLEGERTQRLTPVTGRPGYHNREPVVTPGKPVASSPTERGSLSTKSSTDIAPPDDKSSLVAEIINSNINEAKNLIQRMMRGERSGLSQAIEDQINGLIGIKAKQGPSTKNIGTKPSPADSAPLSTTQGRWKKKKDTRGLKR